MGSTWLSRTALGWIAVCLFLAWLPRNARSAEGEVPEDPTLLIDASYQDSREGDPAFWYSIRYHGQEVVSSQENQAQQDDGAGGSEPASGSPNDGRALVAGQQSGEADAGGASGQSERSFPALRLDYDWSSESDGPDLLRLHFGDQQLTRELGLRRLLSDWTGAIEVNATHNLGAVNMNVGIERPFFGLLDPGDDWAHYLLVGADLERVSPEDGNSTTHGNVTLEGWWSRGWFWHPERELDPAKVGMGAVSAVTRGGKSSMKQVTTGIGLAGKVIEASINAIGYERVDISPPNSGYEATLESALLKGRDSDLTEADWSNLDTALRQIQGLGWEGGLRDKLTAQATRMAGIKHPDNEGLRSTRGRPTFWDLLAVTVPAVGGIHEDVIRCVHEEECDKPWRELAGAFRAVLGDIVARFSIQDQKVAKGSLRLLAAEDEEPVLINTGDDLVGVFIKQPTQHEVRSVPALVFSLDAVAWAPVGGDEGYTFRGNVEPRLLWRFGPTAKTGISARYAYGYERSTRTKKINEWFVGLTYAVM